MSLSNGGIPETYTLKDGFEGECFGENESGEQWRDDHGITKP